MCFININLVAGYYKVRFAKEETDKTLFSTKYGSFKSLVMNFGKKCASNVCVNH